MGLQSQIQWTDHTWNPWMGCEKVSEACANCYMFTEMRRYGKDPDTVQRSKTTFDAPLKKSRDGSFKIPDGSKVFTASWSDFFHEDADQWRPEAWEIIKQRPGVIFQVVTKRTERLEECLPPDWGEGYPNVWLIATVEKQKWLVRACDLQIVPAALRGLSCEPLLGEMDLSMWLGVEQYMPGMWRKRTRNAFDPRIDWVIVGGESGPTVRPTHVSWIRRVVAQCKAAGVPVFVKQLGRKLRMSEDEWGQLTRRGTTNPNYLLDAPGDDEGCLSFHDPKGGDMDEWPEDLRVREFPNAHGVRVRSV